VRIGSLTPGVTNGIPALTWVTITDDDGSIGSSPLLDVFRSPDPDPPGSLRVTLMPVHAQWRLSFESYWRSSGELAVGLEPGSYRVEFRHLAGYVEQEGATVTIPSTPVMDRAFNWRPIRGRCPVPSGGGG
jgi:hypothetical protein